ncbi:hypothetical protein [Sphingopyxis sp. GW247-27LB]|uniref:hypothetical protein n=1 Tax=Sphingopyxis sp. GW247-27LB TaxID=2012632 RepID=UPI000BA7D7BC|nr:hypothetical protein [Sphingopyxis sp. GW247-27LB]PAL20201.1 hypothetical protein CD928_17485 [Sphingopyxis sp. GW247-27LB]
MTAPRVSDHALLRFLERAGGLAVEQLRAQLETSLDRAATAADTIGGGDYLIVADGLAYVIRSGTVTTVMDEGNPGVRARMLDPRGSRG